MYHSITFEEAGTKRYSKNRNTWEDWHLIPSSRPSFVLPAMKTNYVDIPGSNGSLDLSTVLTDGEPCYENREGTFEFFTDPDFKPWPELYSEIANYLAGREFKVILEDDKEYYYRGRFMLDQWITDRARSRISIKYSVDPFKWRINTSNDTNWLWDPFNLRTGVIHSSLWGNIKVASNDWQTLTFAINVMGSAPVCPIVYAHPSDGGTIDLRFYSNGGGIIESMREGQGYQRNEFVLSQSENKIDLKGHGYIELSFREGKI